MNNIHEKMMAVKQKQQINLENSLHVNVGRVKGEDADLINVLDLIYPVGSLKITSEHVDLNKVYLDQHWIILLEERIFQSRDPDSKVRISNTFDSDSITNYGGDYRWIDLRVESNPKTPIINEPVEILVYGLEWYNNEEKTPDFPINIDIHQVRYNPEKWDNDREEILSKKIVTDKNGEYRFHHTFTSREGYFELYTHSPETPDYYAYPYTKYLDVRDPSLLEDMYMYIWKRVE
jgi:hypothetical protein